MTITATEAPTAPAPVLALGLDFAERVSLHMQKHFPDTVAAASWQVARDERDNTAVVVAFPGDDPNLPGSCYGIHAYRWLCSLRDAGFTAEARTDMEVFGRPDEEAPGGRARWLHVTAWAKPVPVKPLILSPGRRDHYVQFRPTDHPPVDAVTCKGVRADLAVFTYNDEGLYGGMTVAVYADGSGHQVAVNAVPAWLWDIGEAHRGHRDALWCYLANRPAVLPPVA